MAQFIHLLGERYLTQWDANRQLAVPECDEVHFAMLGDAEALVLLPDDGVVAIPNQLLQRHGTLCAWTVTNDVATARIQIWVHPKPKPEDYVLEPTEVVDIIKMIESLDERVRALEAGETGDRGLAAHIGAINIERIAGDSYAEVIMADEATNTYDIDMYLGYAYDEEGVRTLIDQRMAEYQYEINTNGELLQIIN